MTHDDTARTVPPFIPGLLIVALLLVISLLIGYRSYVRRVNMNVAVEGAPDWSVWDVLEGGMPKLWEVGVQARDVDGSVPAVAGWDRIMPLSATHLSIDPPTTDAPQSHSPTLTPRRPSRFHRSKFLSPSTTTPPTPPAPAPPLTDHLQISVLISMPALPASIRPKSPRTSLSSSIDIDGKSSTHTQKIYHLLDDEEEEEGAPEVAFGVVVLPCRGTEGVGRAQTTISVT